MSLAAMDLALALRAVFDEERECEHKHHDDPTQASYHSGKAEWYVQMQCGSCGHSRGVVAVCDRWIKVAEMGRVLCSQCLKIDEDVTFLVKERIK